jgi:hypothetical protein
MPMCSPVQRGIGSRFTGVTSSLSECRQTRLSVIDATHNTIFRGHLSLTIRQPEPYITSYKKLDPNLRNREAPERAL